MARYIFHVDMDAFYASVEQRDNPALRGKPVIVGADPRGGSGRGVVAACSYEARNFGIHSALPISQAYRRCPHGVYVRPEMRKYIEASRRIREILKLYARQLEPISIDEAFLDVSDRVSSGSEAIRLAQRMKAEILRKEKLTASVGIGPSKFIAKIASDLKKPDGLLIVREEHVQSFLDPLPVSRIWGVGPKTTERLSEYGISRIGELRQIDADLLVHRFGKPGRHLWKLANGIDTRAVVQSRETKSISQERTFSEDTRDIAEMRNVLEKMSVRLAERLKRSQLAGKTVTLKIRYSDFTTLTRQSSFRDAVDEADQILQIALVLLGKHLDENRMIRLLGIGISSLQKEGMIQRRLF